MRPVDDGMVVCHVDGAGRAGTLAGTAGNAAVVAHESGVGALLGVGAARRNGELALDELDDALLAGARAQPAPDAGGRVNDGDAALVDVDGVLAAHAHARAAADAALLATLQVAAAVAHDDRDGGGAFSDGWPRVSRSYACCCRRPCPWPFVSRGAPAWPGAEPQAPQAPNDIGGTSRRETGRAREERRPDGATRLLGEQVAVVVAHGANRESHVLGQARSWRRRRHRRHARRRGERGRSRRPGAGSRGSRRRPCPRRSRTG